MVTGLDGEDLENFHEAFMRGLQSYPTLLGMNPVDATVELRARYEQVAEELLGPERGRAYVAAFLGPVSD